MAGKRIKRGVKSSKRATGGTSARSSKASSTMQEKVGKRRQRARGRSSSKRKEGTSVLASASPFPQISSSKAAKDKDASSRRISQRKKRLPLASSKRGSPSWIFLVGTPLLLVVAIVVVLLTKSTTSKGPDWDQEKLEKQVEKLEQEGDELASEYRRTRQKEKRHQALKRYKKAKKILEDIQKVAKKYDPSKVVTYRQDYERLNKKIVALHKSGGFLDDE